MPTFSISHAMVTFFTPKYILLITLIIYTNCTYLEITYFKETRYILICIYNLLFIFIYLYNLNKMCDEQYIII